MTRLHTLAEAYADGIVLTPTGCEYIGAAYSGDDPITYWSINGMLEPSLVEDRACCICSPGYIHIDAKGLLLGLKMRTPGDPTQRLTYLMEVSVVDEEGGWPDLFSFRLYQHDLELSPTSAGSRLAMIQLIGTRGRSPLDLRMETTRSHQIVYFNWLNVIAL